MLVRDGMSDVVLSVGPGHTLREVSAAMCTRRVGAAVVLDPEAQGPGVITERDILMSIASGEDPDQELVANHLTAKLTVAAPDWSLEHAAAAMVRGGFRHLVVVEGGELAGRAPVHGVGVVPKPNAFLGQLVPESYRPRAGDRRWSFQTCKPLRKLLRPADERLPGSLTPIRVKRREHLAAARGQPPGGTAGG